MSHGPAGGTDHRVVVAIIPRANRGIAGDVASRIWIHREGGLTSGGASKSISRRQFVATSVSGFGDGNRQRRCGREAIPSARPSFLPAVRKRTRANGSPRECGGR